MGQASKAHKPVNGESDMFNSWAAYTSKYILDGQHASPRQLYGVIARRCAHMPVFMRDGAGTCAVACVEDAVHRPVVADRECTIHTCPIDPSLESYKSYNQRHNKNTAHQPEDQQ
jgi:hypothetical protein